MHPVFGDAPPPGGAPQLAPYMRAPQHPAYSHNPAYSQNAAYGHSPAYPHGSAYGQHPGFPGPHRGRPARRRGRVGSNIAALLVVMLAITAWLVPSIVLDPSTISNPGPDTTQQQPGQQKPDPGTQGEAAVPAQPGNLAKSLSEAKPPTVRFPPEPKGPEPRETGPIKEGTVLNKGVPGLVIVESTMPGYLAGGGTGLIATPDGYVITNYHVVQGSSGITVQDTHTKKRYEATLVGHNALKDIAVLKLNNASNLRTIATRYDEKVTLGMRVTVIGNGGAKGVLQQLYGRITDLSVNISTRAQGSVPGGSLKNLLATSADVVQGYSGGAMMNRDGRVVGMTVAASEGPNARMVYGYAIPINTVIDETQRILDGNGGDGTVIGRPAAFGITIRTDEKPNPRAPGLIIESFLEDSPLPALGIKKGDRITKLNGKTIESYTDLKRALAPLEPGQKVSIAWSGKGGGKDGAGQGTVTLIRSSVN